MNSKRQPFLRKPRFAARGHLQRGFTLVEASLALGIVALALTTILGLVPVGLEVNRESRQSTAAMRTARNVVADLRLSATIATGPDSQLSMVSPRFGINLDRDAEPVKISIPVEGSVSGDTHRVVITVLPSSPDSGKSGCYEVVVKVIWGLPESVAEPNGYSNHVSLYAATVL